MSHNTFQIKQIIYKEALNDVLKSIAFIEAGLSEIVNIGARGITFYNGLYNYENCSVSHIKEMNSNYYKLLKKIIKLQMNLNQKLKTILNSYSPALKKDDSFTPSVPEVLTELPVYNTPQKDLLPDDSFNTFPEESCKTETDKINDYFLRGRGIGIVSEPFDHFRDGISMIQIYYNTKHEDNVNYLYYIVQRGTEILEVSAPLAYSELYTDCGSKTITLEGTCINTYRERFKNDIKCMGTFKLSIYYTHDNPAECSFRLTIKDLRNSVFNHDSGNIKVDSSIEFHPF